MKLSLVLTLSLATSVTFASKSQDKSNFPATPLRLQDFEKLQVSADPKIGLQTFSQNLGLRLNSASSVRNVFYASSGFKKWVFVQAHLAVADKAEGEITTLPDGKSFFSIRGASNFFILAKGFERQELFQLQKNVQKSITSNVTSNAPRFEFQFKSTALAGLLTPTNATASASCISSQEIQQTLVTTNESDFKILKSVWGCIQGTGAGVWNSTGGVVTAAYDIVTKGSEQILCGAASLANAEWSRCSDYATAMQNTIDSTLHTLGNLKQVTGEMAEGFSNLPADVQVKVLCELKGTVETGAAVSFVTAGAGAPAALSRLSQTLNKVADLPTMSKSSGTIKSMALKVEQKAQDKAAALATVKSISRDVQESLKKIEASKVEFASNSNKAKLYSEKLDLQWQKIEDNPSRYATENLIMNSHTRLENILKLNRSTKTEDKELASQLLRYAKLSDKEKELAQSILKSNGSNVAKHDANADIIKLAQSIKDKRLQLRDDLTFATSEEYTKLTRDYIALQEKSVRANRSVASSKQKLSDEITHYWELVDKKNLSQQDKDILKSQVSAYMTTSLCNAAASISESSANATEKGLR